MNDAKETARQALNDVGITHHKGDISIRKLSIAEVARVSIANYASSCRHRCNDLFASLEQKMAADLVQLLRTVAK